MTHTRTLVGALAALALGLSVALTPGPVAGTPAALPACASEDGSGGPVPCWWDASTRGNGQGSSYVVTGVPA